MEIRFSRTEISSINSFKKSNGYNSIDTGSKKVDVPKEESFEYVLNSAKSGNEMAAVQIDEWYRYCKPRSSTEKCVLNQIKKAVDEIFE